MYLYHYGFRKLPFSLTPDTELFCALPGYREALQTLKFALESGEAFCKVIGEVGAGKTMLCRLLLNKIGEQRKVAYIPNPVLSPRELKLALAHELQMRIPRHLGEEQLIPKIQQKLIEIAGKQGPVVLVIDEAQSMPDDTLETLRLFTNLESESTKLLQIILFAQPELDDKLAQKHLRQLRQRIAFSYHLRPLNFAQLRLYLNHRLARVSTRSVVNFSYPALLMLYWASRGIPRLINILAHKSLMLGFGKGCHKIGLSQVWYAVADTEDTRGIMATVKAAVWLFGIGLFSTSALAFWVLP
jgi:MSHA biogenesis protein MshM